MPSHRINLRGPWDFTWRRRGDDLSRALPESGTVAMPREWQAIFGLAGGTVQFRRKFHRPTNLEPHERVMIVFTESRGTGEVGLNGLSVGQFAAVGDAVEFEISTLMKPFNELSVEITFDPNLDPAISGGLFGVVALEIRSE